MVAHFPGLCRFNSSELPTTVIELDAMAIAANIGLRRTPVKGYSTPAGKRIKHFRCTTSVGLMNFLAEPFEVGSGLAAPVQDAADSFLRFDLFYFTRR